MFDIFVGMSINFKIYDNNFPEIFNKLSDENILKLRSDIRDEYETIIVGANTIKIDNPNLLNSKKNNIRLIIDKYADLSLDSNIFKNIPNQTYILLLKNKKEYIQNLKEMGVNVILFEETDDLKILKKIKEISKGKVLIEGGSKIIEMFLKYNMIHQIKLVRFSILLPSNTLSLLNDFQLYKKLNIVDYRVINDKFIYEVFEI